MKKITTLILTILFIASSYSQDLVVFKRGKKYGFKNKITNKVVIKPKYYNVKKFSDGLAPVKIKKNYNAWAYINTKGEITIQGDGNLSKQYGTYYYASLFYNGIAIVKGEKGLYCINKDGIKINNPDTKNLQALLKNTFSEDYNSVEREANVRKYRDIIITSYMLCYSLLSRGYEIKQFLVLNGKYGVIDDNYLIIFPFIYDGIKSRCGSSKLVVKKGDKYGVINKNGEILVDFIYDDILACFGNKTGIGAAKMGNKWGFIDKNGEAITSFVFDEIENSKLYRDIYLVKIKNRYDDSWMELDMNNMSIKKYIWIYD